MNKWISVSKYTSDWNDSENFLLCSVSNLYLFYYLCKIDSAICMNKCLLELKSKNHIYKLAYLQRENQVMGVFHEPTITTAVLSSYLLIKGCKISKIIVLCPWFKFKFPNTAVPVLFSLVIPSNIRNPQLLVVKRKPFWKNPELQMWTSFSCKEAINVYSPSLAGFPSNILLLMWDELTPARAHYKRLWLFSCK